MQFSAIILSAAALLATGAHAWTKDANGVWVANNTYYTIRGCKSSLQSRFIRPESVEMLTPDVTPATVHEACTTMNTESVHGNGAFCAYWTNGVGGQFKGSKFTPYLFPIVEWILRASC